MGRRDEKKRSAGGAFSPRSVHYSELRDVPPCTHSQSRTPRTHMSTYPVPLSALEEVVANAVTRGPAFSVFFSHTFPSTVKLPETAVCTPAFIFLTFHSLTFYNLAYALIGCTEIFSRNQQSLFCQKSRPLASRAFRSFMLATPAPHPSGSLLSQCTFKVLSFISTFLPPSMIL